MDTQEQEKKFSGEAAAEREKLVKEFFSTALSKFRERKNLEIDDLIRESSGQLPDALQEMVMRDLDRLKGYNVLNEEMLKQEVEISARKAYHGYVDKKLEMPNGDLARLETMQAINDILERENPNLEDLKKVARVCFDLNGLKAVNDLSGDHHKGDEYLRLVKEALEDREIRSWAESQGFTYIACREGGDEFSAIIRSEKPLTEEIINSFIVRVQAKLENDPRPAELLNFNQDDVLLRFAGITAEEVAKKGEDWKKEKLAQIKTEVPPDFKYTAHISVGAATLYDGLMDERNDEKNKIHTDDAYERVLQKIMGCLFYTGDQEMYEEKFTFKKNLLTGDPDEQMLGKIYARTEEEREKNVLIMAMRKVDSLKDDLIKLYEAGAGQETIEAKKKEITEAAKELI